MRTKIFFLGVMLTFGLNITNAQIGNYVRNKAVNAAFRAGDKKVDEKIDEALEKDKKEKEGTTGNDKTKTDQNSGNSESGSSNNSSSDARSKAMMGRLGISMERPANIKDKYDYMGNILMTMQSWDENGESDGEILYTTHYSADKQGFAMKFEGDEKKNSVMIFDNENQMMIILSDEGKDKTGMVMAIANAAGDSTSNSTTSEVNDPNDYYSKFKKTGKTKKVSGYECDEYVFEDENLKGSYWMTTDLSANLWANMFNNATIPLVMQESLMDLLWSGSMKTKHQRKNHIWL